jgi:hypothetical protein
MRRPVVLRGHVDVVDSSNVTGQVQARGDETMSRETVLELQSAHEGGVTGGGVTGEGVTGGGVTGGSGGIAEGGQVKKPLVAMGPLRQPRVASAVKTWKPATRSGSQLKIMLPLGVVTKSVQV